MASNVSPAHRAAAIALADRLALTQPAGRLATTAQGLPVMAGMARKGSSVSRGLLQRRGSPSRGAAYARGQGPGGWAGMTVEFYTSPTIAPRAASTGRRMVTGAQGRRVPCGHIRRDADSNSGFNLRIGVWSHPGRGDPVHFFGLSLYGFWDDLALSNEAGSGILEEWFAGPYMQPGYKR